MGSTKRPQLSTRDLSISRQCPPLPGGGASAHRTATQSSSERTLVAVGLKGLADLAMGNPFDEVAVRRPDALTGVRVAVGLEGLEELAVGHLIGGVRERRPNEAGAAVSELLTGVGVAVGLKGLADLAVGHHLVGAIGAEDGDASELLTDVGVAVGLKGLAELAVGHILGEVAVRRGDDV